MAFPHARLTLQRHLQLQHRQLRGLRRLARIQQPMLYGRMLFGGIIPLCSVNIIGGDRFGSYVEQQMPFAGMGHAEHIDNQFVAMQLSAYQRIATNNYVLLKLAAACISHKPADLLRACLLLQQHVRTARRLSGMVQPHARRLFLHQSGIRILMCRRLFWCRERSSRGNMT